MSQTPAAGWTALVLAGERPADDPTGRPFGPGPKAMVAVGGRPMVARVAETLLATAGVERVVVLAQDPGPLRDALPAGVELAMSGPGIAASIAQVAGTKAAPWPVLVTTADHPLLTPATVAQFLADVEGADVAVGFVARRTVLARHPTTRRTWLHMADGGWTGANLFALGGSAARPALDHWAGIERERKRAWRLLLTFGPVLAALALARRLTLAEALRRAGQRLGPTARAVPLDDPDAAIDVDRPADRRLAELILWARDDVFHVKQPMKIAALVSSPEGERVLFDCLEHTVARGPTAVARHGGRVLGGGWVAATETDGGDSEPPAARTAGSPLRGRHGPTTHLPA